MLFWRSLNRISDWWLRTFNPDCVACTLCSHPAWCHPGYWLFEDLGREVLGCLGVYGKRGSPRMEDLKPGIITCPCPHTYEQVSGRVSREPNIL